jgi:uncharacterized protein
VEAFIGPAPLPTHGEVADWIAGGEFSDSKLSRVEYSFDARKLGLDIPIPFFVIQGRDDRMDSFDAAEAQRPASPGGLDQTVNFADRSTVSSNTYPAEILSSKLDRPSEFAFVSKPFSAPVAVTGLITADLKLVTNKKDLDIGMVFYELTLQGKFFHLADIIQRASYARDPTTRHLLEPGKVESIPIRPTLFVSRQLQRGSRLLVVLDVNKGPFAQINYGTGHDVSDESIADANVPLKVEWLNDSVVNVPIATEAGAP